MYKELTVEDTVRVPPQYLTGTPQENVEHALRSVEGRVNPDIGVPVAILDVLEVGEGEVEPEDPGVHYPVTYKTLVFKPELHEIVLGEVTDITEFGAFIRIGPIEALCHVSQLMDEYVSYNEENNQFANGDGDKLLQVGDAVLARITAVSLKSDEAHKINLTMRQDGLGKLEWLEEEREEAENEDDGDDQ